MEKIYLSGLTPSRLLLAAAILVCSFFIRPSAHANTCLWDGSGASITWNTASNWTNCGGVTPTSADTVLFNGTNSGSVTVNTTVSVLGFNIASGYRGTISQGSSNIFVGTSNFVMTGTGTFTGGSGSLTASGFTLQARDADQHLNGTFTAPSGTFTVRGDFAITGGTFAHNNGTVVLGGRSADQALALSGSVLKNLTLNNTAGGTSDDINVGDGSQLLMSGALVITLGNLNLTTNSEALVVDDGDITLASDSQATFTTNSNVTHSGSLTVNSSAGFTVSAGTWTNISANDVTYTLNGAGRHFNAFTLNNTGGGSLDDFIVAGGGLNCSGALTLTLGNLDLSTNSQNLVVEGAIAVASAAQATLTGGGDIYAGGNVSTGASGSWSNGATSTLTMNGTTQTLDTNNSSFYNLTISSSSSTTLASNETVTNALTVGAGSSFVLSTFTLTATDATITNGGTITESTGYISHKASTFLLTDSGFSAQDDFKTDATLYFTITDSDENIDGTSTDSVDITVTLASGDSETVSLTETAVASGIFRGSLVAAQQAAASGNGKLDTTADALITATFTDAQDGLSNVDNATLSVIGGSSSSGGGGGGGGGGGRGGGGGGGHSVKSPAVNVSPVHNKVTAPDNKTPTIKSIKDTKKLTPAQKRQERAAARKAKRGSK